MKTNTRVHERGGVYKSKKRRVRRKARQRTYSAARVQSPSALRGLVLEPSFVSVAVDTNGVSTDNHARGFECARDASHQRGRRRIRIATW